MLLVTIYLELPQVEVPDLSAKLRRVDIFGSITLVAVIFALLMTFDHGGNVSWTDTTARLSQSGFVVALLLFIVSERWVAREPIAPGNVIFNNSLMGAYLSNFFGVAVMMTVFFYIPLYLQAVREMSASKTSFWLVFTVLAGLSGSLGGGFIMQATGRFYAITVIAYVVLVAGSVLLLLSTGTIAHSVIGVALGMTAPYLELLTISYAFTGLIFISLGNGELLPICKALYLMCYSIGAGTTTALIALISNSGKDNQAIVTAGEHVMGA